MLAFQVRLTLLSPPAATTLAGAPGPVVSGVLGGAVTSNRSKRTFASAPATVKARTPALESALKKDARLVDGMMYVSVEPAGWAVVGAVVGNGVRVPPLIAYSARTVPVEGVTTRYRSSVLIAAQAVGVNSR